MTTPETPTQVASGLWRQVQGFADSLAGRLLGLTVVAVIVGEVLIFVPALADFHETWLMERINQAQIAALALEASPDNDIADQLTNELLNNAGVQHVALQRENERVLLLDDPNADAPAPHLVTYDYRQASPVKKFNWAFETFFAHDGRVLRVLSRPRFESGDFIEVVLREAPLRAAMLSYAQRFLWLSTLILMAAGALIYVSLTLAFVRPMREITQAIEQFRDKPEDVSVAFPRSRRGDEIGRAQRAAADMAEQVRIALRQKERLAALGAAVARIGHDLRNMLSTAQLVADRLQHSEDENVRKLAPRLERTITRASGLAASTLKYGRFDERTPELQRVDVGAAVNEAADDALAGFADILLDIDVEPALACVADPENLNRVLVNLIRNAAQAMRRHDDAENVVTVRAARQDTQCVIEVIDSGAGVPDKIRERLFEPFATSAPEDGGTGLGLAIARELTRAMGGELELTRTGAVGSTFLITLPVA
jgi:signal transduction histidine kinase